MEKRLLELKDNLHIIVNKESIDSSSFINTSSKSLFVNTMKDKDFGPPKSLRSKKSLKPNRSTRNIQEQSSMV